MVTYKHRSEPTFLVNAVDVDDSVGGKASVNVHAINVGTYTSFSYLTYRIQTLISENFILTSHDHSRS